MRLKSPTVEQCVKEDALEVQDISELGLGWAWFMNDLRAFSPSLAGDGACFTIFRRARNSN